LLHLNGITLLGRGIGIAGGGIAENAD